MHSPSDPLGEFDLIQRFFKTGAQALKSNSSIALGIGDDCALLRPTAGQEIAITSDMLVEGRHFLSGANPELLGRKALAVNLSDLAAMGANPLGFTLALALPKVDSAWLEGFSKGLFSMANEYSCSLIGGDTTAGPLNICITAFGSIPIGKAIQRKGAKVGEDIWVSGELGDARLTLAALRHEVLLPDLDLKQIEHRMHQPTPRVELGIQLRGIASAALDISDGLLGDLKHILKESQVDAQIFLDLLPKSAILRKQSEALQNEFAACGGDDYEICFIAPSDQRNVIEKLSSTLHLPFTRIGQITVMKNTEASIVLVSADGKRMSDSDTKILLKSFDHFAS
ncbi:thiamine-phosphate kinase [Polynucleobacter sp. AP-Melu-500A-A1]|uniref:thiamine-phosphate kinase n=1 Tax=Polynucleobacter sp. AP-Melu-500A-A1 TaxID=2576929 RepID=UPI001C0B02CA|nr:thiamine-phosphate kinase [Polynucleobacter sp. AP-Melu-500A-A1]MBU3629943.1 thiamine-phosphate kinase [Polynucleobacter sp. AP-Melu-500A-A1]